MENKNQIDFHQLLADGLKIGRIENLKIISADLKLDYQTLINKLNFSSDCLNIKQLINYLEHPGVDAAPFIKHFSAHFKHIAIPIKHDANPTYKELHHKMTDVIQEVGDVASELNQATKDEHITSSERVKFKKEINEAIQALVALNEQFKSVNTN